MPREKDTDKRSKKTKNSEKWDVFDWARKLGPVEERPGEVHAVLFVNPKRHRRPEEDNKAKDER
jgi:hypothetical protein